MKSLIAFFILLLTGCSAVVPQIPQDVLAELQASDKSMFNMAGEINGNLQNNLNRHLKNKKVGDTLLIYINSNGGEVNSAEAIMNTLAGYKTICVADIAMSAAFEIFQTCTVRVYMDRTLLMVHHHWIIFNNNQISVPDLFATGLEAYIQELSILSRCAFRMKITYNDLDKKIQKNGGEWYLYGSDIIKNNAADYHIKDSQLKKNK